MKQRKSKVDSEYANLYSKFVKTNKSLIIAPAGYGKTHTISEVILNHNGKYLILTHTNAGIASIKEKIKKQDVVPSRYAIETISGYAQKYVQAYTDRSEIPEQENRDMYFPFVYKRMLEILNSNTIKSVIKQSYDSVIIDEYQDCNAVQHQIILMLSSITKVHALGDGLQGIFNFKRDTLDWKNVESDFKAVGKLNDPWRWIINESDGLGKDIADIRSKLDNRSEINLADYKSIDLIKVNDKGSTFNTQLYKILNSEKNVLVIEPNSSNRIRRLSLVTQFKGRLSMLESIDSEVFYDSAKQIDLLGKDFYNNFLDLVLGKKSQGKRKSGLFTRLGYYLQEEKPRNSGKRQWAVPYSLIMTLREEFNKKELIKLLESLPKVEDVGTPSYDLYKSLLRAASLSEEKGITVYEAMVEIRNKVRRGGKRIYGRVVGTTLLTKGLEFDCVVITNAGRFKDEKNFYVAVSRATKKLVIFTDTTTLNFFQTEKPTNPVEQNLLF